MRAWPVFAVFLALVQPMSASPVPGPVPDAVPGAVPDQVARPLKRPVPPGADGTAPAPAGEAAVVTAAQAPAERPPLARPSAGAEVPAPAVIVRAPPPAPAPVPDPTLARADPALAGASLFPRPRPEDALLAVRPGAVIPATVFLAEPRPLARPAGPAAKDGPERVIDAAAIITQPAPSVTTGRKGALCGDPAIQGTTMPGITSRIRGCGMGQGAKISSIDGIRMSPAVTVDCPTALALRAWITDGLRPAVGKRGGGVSTIEVLGGYDCRPVNNKPGNKISEHGRGNAIDIGGFILADGEVIRVLWHWGKGQQGRILKAMHWAACNDFGTVLGPAANAYHRNHFHFDTARRRSSYCR